MITCVIYPLAARSSTAACRLTERSFLQDSGSRPLTYPNIFRSRRVSIPLSATVDSTPTQSAPVHLKAADAELWL